MRRTANKGKRPPSKNGRRAGPLPSANGVNGHGAQVRFDDEWYASKLPSANGVNGEAAVTPARADVPPALPAAPLPATPPPSEGREPSGRFAKGNPGGPGNPFARRVALLRSALLEVVDESRLKRIAAKLADLAEAGDVAAIKLLLAYVVGKPADTVDPDRVDVDELRLRGEWPGLADVLTAASKIVAREALAIIRTLEEERKPVRLSPEEDLQDL